MQIFSDDPKEAMRQVVDLMRSVSRETDPQHLMKTYRQKVGRLTGFDATISLSRRGLEKPWYRITRSSLWNQEIDPWKEKERLPLYDRGLLSELIYADEPRIINNLRVDPADPAYDLLKDFGSALAIPHYDNGVGLNMVVSLKRSATGFDEVSAPTHVWLSNLFGRTTYSLVMAKENRRLYEALDRELRAVSEIQRSLLPAVLPDVQGLELAVHYQTSQQAGGDYYDLFPLPDGRLGVLIADVSGHGTPAAVLMAITHTVAHSYPGHPDAPGKVLSHLNARLSEAYARTPGGFVTAFYGVYDPTSRSLTYASAGHNPPRVRRGGVGGEVSELDGARDLPLGISEQVNYGLAELKLEPNDLLLLYTDGITEARAPSGGQMFGESRLDSTLSAAPEHAGWTIAKVVEAVEKFTHHAPAGDDRTLVAAKVL